MHRWTPQVRQWHVQGQGARTKSQGKPSKSADWQPYTFNYNRRGQVRHCARLSVAVASHSSRIFNHAKNTVKNWINWGGIWRMTRSSWNILNHWAASTYEGEIKSTTADTGNLINDVRTCAWDFVNVHLPISSKQYPPVPPRMSNISF